MLREMVQSAGEFEEEWKPKRCAGGEPLNVYPDQNFLIYCVRNPDWKKAILDECKSGRISIVLSPWHFFECGNASGHPDTDAMIQLVEETKSKWILERADIQRGQLFAVWNSIWAGDPLVFDPIRNLAEMGAVLNRVPVERMAKYSVRDYIRSFSSPGALDQMREAMREQTDIAKFNMKRYVADKQLRNLLSETELKHVAVQIARRTEIIPKNVYALADQLLAQQPISTQIHCFVFWRCTKFLTAYLTEVGFTLDLYPSGAVLSVNRQIDRNHAISALPFCDVFVTDDEDLIKRSKRVKATLKFSTAKIMRGQEFMDTLQFPQRERLL